MSKPMTVWTFKDEWQCTGDVEMDAEYEMVPILAVGSARVRVEVNGGALMLTVENGRLLVSGVGAPTALSAYPVRSAGGMSVGYV